MSPMQSVGHEVTRRVVLYVDSKLLIREIRYREKALSFVYAHIYVADRDVVL